MRSPKKLFLWLAAGIIGFFLACTFYIFFLQTPLLFRREFAFAFLLLLLLTPLLYLLLSRLLLPWLYQYSPKGRINWLLLSTAVGILFALVTRPPQTFFLLPTHTLQINLPAGEADRSMTLEYATTSLRDIGFSEFKMVGKWLRTEAGLSHYGAESASLTWVGLTGESARLYFTDSPAISEVKVGWDGNVSSIDSSNVSDNQIKATYHLQTGLLFKVGSRMFIIFTAGFLFLAITLFLASIELKSTEPVKQKKGYWLVYALPMVAVWGIYLLTFYPGMMSIDSSNQWQQVVSLQLNDQHPVFHTLLIWLITRVWYSPAAVVVFQILFLSLTVAWGINQLDEQGLPQWAAWLLTSFFAFSPINGDLVIILWKDIPYSTSLLLLSLFILKIIFTEGQWLSKKYIWIWLSLVCLCVASFRHNGIPIPFLVLPILGIFYRKYWKPLLGALSIFLALVMLIRGPVYDSLKVERSLGFSESIIIHHIAAHVVNGGPLSPEQEKVANEIIKMNEWRYDCCSTVATRTASSHSDEKNWQNATQINHLALELAQKEPLVDLEHQVCISALVWEIPNRCGVKSFLPDKYQDGSIHWIDNSKINSGFIENSQLPILIPPLSDILVNLSKSRYFSFLLSPSIYFYLMLFCVSFYAFRDRNLRSLLFLLPACVQSIVLIIFNVSSEFRYQFGVILIGIFSLGLLHLALQKPIKGNQKKVGYLTEN